MCTRLCGYVRISGVDGEVRSVGGYKISEVGILTGPNTVSPASPFWPFSCQFKSTSYKVMQFIMMPFYSLLSMAMQLYPDLMWSNRNQANTQ